MDFFRCSTVTVHSTVYKSGCYLVNGLNYETSMTEFVS